ncbi:glycosyltransferase family 39 protein [Inconstantimicrobium porci]|uniref:glycosyltransferase family 39 protein n=1 Tax=Inconstantimicrobium porci TaxID=2652291 RepID=UPI002409F84E|nr:glycosyltransferase family 39 protein [Inconstantimicrobium porci]MDD6771684.1 glycosyltransferase family 39 protein [Inconstantimicrobium porci]
MSDFSHVINKMLDKSIKFIILIILVSACCVFMALFFRNTIKSILMCTIVVILALLSEYIILKADFSYKVKVLMILFVSVILKIIWNINTCSYPNSDFKVMYDIAGDMIKGDFSGMKGLGYIARFPHLTFTVKYMLFIKFLAPYHNILIMKMINISFSTVTVFIVYLIADILFENKKKSMAALIIASLFPTFITYTAVFCGENIAMIFYVLSIYLFLKSWYSKRNKIILLFVSGVCLAVGNLFRMVALVMLTIYCIYILVYSKKSIIYRLSSIIAIIMPYLLIIIIISSSLQKCRVTERPLWSGSEPKITNILKGTNFESLGMWNERDAQFVEKNLGNYTKLIVQCRNKIRHRIIDQPKLKVMFFYMIKLCSQWCVGDFGGCLWTQKDVCEGNIILKISMIGTPIFQLMFIIMLVSILCGIKKESSNKIYLLYLIFLGYVVLYLITENQSRYGYIVSWIFVLLAASGIESTLNILKKIKSL